ncbi:nitroreductase/quinone reductase family protein [Amycolatopsis sp. cmx-8-4]|uniref:nitroreductase/quinone reductase family protein n=1 Tax=Amycolatopsis sp. cmx-8-4 TaxID=2790947 RepID=UPI00397B2516
MDSPRKTALVAGVLHLLTFVSIPTLALYGPVRDRNYVRIEHDDVHAVRAREVHGEEKDRWWLIAETFWPHFPEYRAKAAGREIPIVVLERQ